MGRQMGEIMRIGTSSMLAAIMIGLSGAAGSPAHAQPENQVAECVRGDWQSTSVSVVHPGMEDLRIGGGDGVSLMIEPSGAATADFTDMGRVTFAGSPHGTTVRGFVRLDGEATGTVSTA